MDQGTTEKVEPPVSELEQKFQGLFEVYLQVEKQLSKLNDEFRNKPAGMIRADALMGFLGFMSKLNRMSFMWVKLALDEKEQRTDAKEDKLQTTFQRIDKFMEEYGTFLAKWKNEDQTIRSRVQSIGTR